MLQIYHWSMKKLRVWGQPTSLLAAPSSAPSNTYIGQRAALFRTPLNTHRSKLAALFRLPAEKFLKAISCPFQGPARQSQFIPTNHKSVYSDQPRASLF